MIAEAAGTQLLDGGVDRSRQFVTLPTLRKPDLVITRRLGPPRAEALSPPARQRWQDRGWQAGDLRTGAPPALGEGRPSRWA